MKIEPFMGINDQAYFYKDKEWSVARLITLAAQLPVFEIPISHLNIAYCYDSLSLRDMVMHFIAVQKADLSFPIILDEDGNIMDGRHRVMKALMEGAKKIKAVRFEINPPPCRYRS